MRKELALSLATLLIATAAQAAPRGQAAQPLVPGAAIDPIVVRLIDIPGRMILAPFRALSAEPQTGEGIAIDPLAGWTRVGVPLREGGEGVCLDVTGRVQVGRVEIVFEDGGMQRIDVNRSHVYGRGLYHLAQFPADRAVMLVRLEALARTSDARVRLLLVRGQD